MRRRTKINFSFLFLVPYLVLTIIPMFKYRFSYKMTLPFVCLWALLNVVTPKKFFLQHLSRLFWGAFVMLTLFAFLRFAMSAPYRQYGTTYSEFVSVCTSLFPMLMVYFVVSRSMYFEGKVIWWLLIVLLAFGGVNLLRFDAGAARILASGSADFNGAMDRAELVLAGAGGYGIVYSLAMVCSLLIYWAWFAKGILRFIVLALFVVFVACVYHAAYSLATIEILIGVLFAIFALKKIKTPGKLNWFFGSIGLFLVISVAYPQMYSFAADWLMNISQLIKVDQYAYRLQSLADAVRGHQGTYMEGRSSLYWLSWDTFISHPILGCFGDGIFWEQKVSVSDSIGGHSTVFDALGGCGIVVTSMLIASIVMFVRFLSVLYQQNGISTIAIKGVLVSYYPLFIVACLNPLFTPEILLTACYIIPMAPFAFNAELDRRGR